MFSLRSEGSELGLSSPGVLWDHETPEYLAFEGHQDLYVGQLEAIGNSDFTLKELTQRLTCPEFQNRGSNLKGAWIRPTC